jgi:hypothetical protein
LRALYCGEVIFSHFKHLDFQGFLEPGNLTSGSNPFARIKVSASITSTLFPAQYLHPLLNDLVEVYRGKTTRPHTRHLHFHLVCEFTYGSKGSNPLILINVTASDSGILFVAAALLAEQNLHPLPDLTSDKVLKISLLQFLHLHIHLTLDPG